MTLIISVCAAIVATIAWKMSPSRSRIKVGTLALFYWGASLMWCVDGFAGLIGGEGFIELSDKAAMLDDAALGALVVVVGLAAWAVYLLVTKARAKSAQHA
ncbi:MAG: hypothetical protein ACOYIP_06415 [Coriobacteriales bacterium]|jgi:hypothetical protein